MNENQLLNCLHTAMKAAKAASEAILEIYAHDFEAEWKHDGSPVTVADLASNEVLIAHLKETGIPVITEESQQENFSVRQTYDWVWCIDPLDGTKEFLKKNDEFAVCIALIYKQQSVLGIIASPVQQRMIIGGKDVPPALVPFATLEDTNSWQFIEKKTELNTPFVIAGSRSHLSGKDLDFTNEMREQYGEVEFLTKGSALKFMDLALGTADVYPRFAPTMEWDIAAGQAILEALGGKVLQTESKEPLKYNKENLLNPHFIASTAPLV